MRTGEAFRGRNEFRMGCRDTQLTTDESLRACVDNLLSSDDESARSGTSLGWLVCRSVEWQHVHVGAHESGWQYIPEASGWEQIEGQDERLSSWEAHYKGARSYMTSTGTGKSGCIHKDRTQWEEWHDRVAWGRAARAHFCATTSIHSWKPECLGQGPWEWVAMPARRWRTLIMWGWDEYDRKTDGMTGWDSGLRWVRHWNEQPEGLGWVGWVGWWEAEMSSLRQRHYDWVWGQGPWEWVTNIHFQRTKQGVEDSQMEEPWWPFVLSRTSSNVCIRE